MRVTKQLLSTNLSANSKILVPNKALAIRMVPPKYRNEGIATTDIIKGPATAIFPGIKIGTFTNRESGVGVLCKVSPHKRMYINNAFTSGTVTPSSRGLEEYPSYSHIQASWQPHLPINVVAYLYWKELESKKARESFPFNEARIDGNDEFFGAVITDHKQIGNPELEDFCADLNEALGCKGLYLYNSQNLHKISSTGDIEQDPIKLPKNIISLDTMKDATAREAIKQQYEAYIRNVAEYYYEHSGHDYVRQELEVARVYGDGGDVSSAIYYHDVMEMIGKMHLSNPDKYPSKNTKGYILDSFAKPYIHSDAVESLELREPKPSPAQASTERVEHGYRDTAWRDDGGDAGRD